MEPIQPPHEQPRQERGTSDRLLELLFSKLKELGAGEEAGRLFPHGISSIEMEASGDNESRLFRFALRSGDGQTVTGATGGSLVATSGDDGDIKASFNAEGHKVIALIARLDLEENAPDIATKVSALLDAADRNWDEAATFPDEIRAQQPQTKPFHFVDIPFEDGGPADPPLPNPPHVLTKLEEFSQLVKDGTGDTQEKADNISWLFHLFGDVHQPLHCIQHISALHPDGDRGGNSFRLKGKPNNLHSAWDSSVNVTEDISEEDLAAKIKELHTRETLAQELAETDPEQWARSSFALAKKHAYSIQENPAQPPKLSAAYLKNMEKIGRKQAALAGYRLSDRLQELLQ